MAKYRDAADYIEQVDPAVRIILAELAESAGSIARDWSLAVWNARRDPKGAFQNLLDAEISLSNGVRLELADTLRPIRSAIERLERELPDDEDEPPAE